ncbi:MAG: ligase-associated DNA damage response endonuclease PdeM [Cryomorphaceae bacterium]|nr:ligase-associated DNA damage response endonuclease PdeM [Flavobacteriales bacterium]
MTETRQEVTVEGLRLELLAKKAIMIPSKSALLIADVHLGKVNHFRKNGIPVPEPAGQNNLKRLSQIIDSEGPKEVIFLGDLFHSSANRAWPEFAEFMAGFPKVKFTLVVGNHDILGRHVFEDAGMTVVDHLKLGPLWLTHDRSERDEMFNLYGHIHPAVRLRGSGKQYLKVPCFFFNLKERYGILPSFGDFTGSHVLKPDKDCVTFVTTGKEVLHV